MKKLWDLKNNLSYLELEEQGRGIIMEVTPTPPGTILLGKIAYHTKQIRRECILQQPILKLRLYRIFWVCKTKKE